MDRRNRWLNNGIKTLLVSITLTLSLVGLGSAATASTPDTTIATAEITQTRADGKEFSDRIFELVNQERVRQGMKPLKRLAALDTVAYNWSVQQAKDDNMSHNPRYSSQYPKGWRRAAENVAFGYRTPENMYQGWYNSPGHYANMFNPDFTHVGIGVAFTDRGTPYGTQNFATYTTAPTPTPPRSNIPSDNGSSTRNIDDGGIGGTGNGYYLSNHFRGGDADVVFNYANKSGRVYVGDWDGDGRDSLAYRIGSTFYVRNSNSTGQADKIFTYGRAGDRVYVGDWNGDGKDTFAVRRGKEYHFKNSLSGGNADSVIHYGRISDNILVGDWNGNGRDTLAVRRGAEYHVKNSISGGNADKVVTYGRPNDDVYVGDWDGKNGDSFTVRRGSIYYVANAIRGGEADFTVAYGRSTDTTLVGDWNGDGKDTLGVRR